MAGDGQRTLIGGLTARRFEVKLEDCRRRLLTALARHQIRANPNVAAKATIITSNKNLRAASRNPEKYGWSSQQMWT